MGITGFYLITDPAEDSLNLPAGAYDIPLMLQDRTLSPDNALFCEEHAEHMMMGQFEVVP